MLFHSTACKLFHARVWIILICFPNQLCVGLCTVWMANVILATAEKPLKQYTLQKAYNPIWRHNPRYIGRSYTIQVSTLFSLLSAWTGEELWIPGK